MIVMIMKIANTLTMAHEKKLLIKNHDNQIIKPFNRHDMDVLVQN